MKIRETPAFARHAVKIRRRETFRTENAYIGIALVVGEDDNDVWCVRGMQSGDNKQCD
jgi:hypothetical protein